MSDVTRRRFLHDSTLLAAGLAAVGEGTTATAAEPKDFASRWHVCLDRVWLGPEYWANPLQDWRIAGGRVECVNAALDRNVHLLTRQFVPDRNGGTLKMRVRVGRTDGAPLGEGKGSAGFRIGIQGPLRDYRNSLFYGSGLDVGFTANGGLFIGDVHTAKPGKIKLDGKSLELHLSVRSQPQGRGVSNTLTVAAVGADGKELGESLSIEPVPSNLLTGNLALVANFGRFQPGKGKPKEPPGPGAGTFWFADWRVGGDKVEAHDDRAFGPILFTQYTLHEGTLKLTAQLPPHGAKEPQTATLQTRSDGKEWATAAEARIHPEARTATFRIEKWDTTRDVSYRVVYALTFADGKSEEHHWTGTVRRDPVDQPVLTVANISCNIHAAFPNADYVRKVAKLNPDLLAFTGDQFYESTAGYGVTRAPLDVAVLDYLRKWYVHGWTWRELTRDRPSISIPDDHDVYQGNIWGEAGAPRQGTQERGGYDMPAAWVNVVHRTQTSHHPDSPDPGTVKQGISVYYGPLTWGRVSFAILADRQFKSGPEGKVPPTGGRGDHVTDPKFDPQTADLPGLQLLGKGQMKFLRDWAADWRGADMKAVISQTIFTAMATTHGGERQRLRADYDANGWPQTARNAALREIRKAFAVHLAGDQHLPAVVHYGVESHRDGPVAFAGPAVNVGYPRWWEPTEAGKNRAAGAPENTGDFKDHFGNPLTVLAVANGAVQPRKTVLELMHDKASGLGLVRFDKVKRTITFECWPYLADPSQKGTQFPGWPVTVGQFDNCGGKPAAHLPTLQIEGPDDPVVQVIGEANGEVVYTLRIRGRRFQPHVFAAGKYTVRVSYPESGRARELKGVAATAGNQKVLDVKVGG